MNRTPLPVLLAVAMSSVAQAEPPHVSYIFPAGGQKGTTVPVRIGGHYLHRSARLQLNDPAIQFSPTITPLETVWFEGPMVPLPDSQRPEDYPKDYAGQLTLPADARLGARRWTVATSQGITALLPFIVGDLPEVVEQETDGRPLPVAVTLPVTINGRVFPREDVDVWEFEAKAGETITGEVNSARLGYPLNARLEVLDSQGRRIAEDIDSLGLDARVRFTAKESGRYQMRISDVKSDGLQHYVYRLTVVAGKYVDQVYPLGGRRGSTLSLSLQGTGLDAAPVSVTLPGQGNSFRWFPAEVHGSPCGFLLDLDDLPEHLEEQRPAEQLVFPAVLNGRILQPGEIDEWRFAGKQGESWKLEVHAARLGSALDSVLTVCDATGKELATADDLPGNVTDSQLVFNVPGDGVYTVKVQDRLQSRSGVDFGYRLKATPGNGGAPGFRLTWPAAALTVDRGGEAKVQIKVERLGGFNEPIQLSLGNLPAGVTVTGLEVPGNANQANLTIKSEPTAKPTEVSVTLRGNATYKEQALSAVAEFSVAPGEPDLQAILLLVAVPTPFKFTGVFETKYAPQGSVYVRKYTLERNGFTGPLTVQLADRQGRHLQGVTGPVLQIPPDQNEFEYPITLPTWLEVGRTSRTQLMVVGEVKTEDGTTHQVCYTSNAQNDQIILLADPGQLGVTCTQSSVLARTGQSVTVQVRVKAARELRNAVTVSLLAPAHLRSISADPVTVPAGQEEAELTLRFTAAVEVFNMPVKLRATTLDSRGYPVLAETDLEIVNAVD